MWVHILVLPFISHINERIVESLCEPWYFSCKIIDPITEGNETVHLPLIGNRGVNRRCQMI